MTLHPLHDELVRQLAGREVPAGRAPLPHEIRENMALAALRTVIETHSPATGIGTFVTCSECCELAWPPPEKGGVWSGTEYPCDTVQGIATAYGLGWEDQFGEVHPARVTAEAVTS